jgi:ubiquinone/menaquinone biosynthesis C-methylase UbiE
MSFYKDRVLPHLIHFAMRNHALAVYRARLLSRAKGRVLEIGIGSALNLPFYTPAVNELLGLEPSARLAEMAQNAAVDADLPVVILRGRAEQIALESHSIDTAVTTWTLCSIQDVARGLAEIRRVLKPRGELLFVEHGLAPEAHISKWQRRLTPLWTPVSGGCHLDRAITRLIENAGFEIAALNTGYMRGPKLATFLYEGIARPR